jgi:dihydrofolate synthase / folylpolyglutamate synthase
VLADKDAAGMIRAAADLVDELVVTTAPSDRTTDPDALAATAVGVVGADRVVVEPDLERALETAKELAADHAGAPDDPVQPGVVVFGSITLIAAVLERVREHGWP